MMAAGPAAWEALSAPKSQPDPMIEPTLAKSSPTTPTWRLSCGCDSVDCSVVVMSGVTSLVSLIGRSTRVRRLRADTVITDIFVLIRKYCTVGVHQPAASVRGERRFDPDRVARVVA